MSFYTNQDVNKLNPDNNNIRDFTNVDDHQRAFDNIEESRRDIVARIVNIKNPNPYNIRRHRFINYKKMNQNSILSYLHELNK